jgi:RNA polymerase sigma factor (sigma-70 family)
MSNNKYTEDQIISGIRKGDREVLKYVYNLCYSSVQLFVVKNSGSVEEAKDVFNVALSHFYVTLYQTDFVLKCPVKTFIYSIARKVWHKKLVEKRKDLNFAKHTEEYIEMSDVFDAMEKRNKLCNSIDDSFKILGEPGRTIVSDYFYKNVSAQEIANKMNYTSPEQAMEKVLKFIEKLKSIVVK